MEFEYLTLINLKTKKNAERLGILNEKIDINIKKISSENIIRRRDKIIIDGIPYLEIPFEITKKDYFLNSNKQLNSLFVKNHTLPTIEKGGLLNPGQFIFKTNYYISKNLTGRGEQVVVSHDDLNKGKYAIENDCGNRTLDFVRKETEYFYETEINDNKYLLVPDYSSNIVARRLDIPSVKNYFYVKMFESVFYSIARKSGHDLSGFLAGDDDEIKKFFELEIKKQKVFSDFYELKYFNDLSMTFLISENQQKQMTDIILDYGEILRNNKEILINQDKKLLELIEAFSKNVDFNLEKKCD